MKHKPIEEMSEQELRELTRLPEMVFERKADTPYSKPRKRKHFVLVPWLWIERLEKARYIATYRVALHILYRHWRDRGQPFTLSNRIMATEGVSRWQKWRALRELEQLGLIRIELRERRSPRITIVI